MLSDGTQVQYTSRITRCGLLWRSMSGRVERHQPRRYLDGRLRDGYFVEFGTPEVPRPLWVRAAHLVVA